MARTTISEAIESLTGFEEIAIKKAFEDDVFALMNTGQETMAGRALIFIEKKREGLKDAEAKNAALSLTLKDVNAHFADEDEEVMPDEPVTESGKDAANSD